MSDAHPTPADHAPPPPLKIALMIWVGVIAALAAFIVIGTMLGLEPLYAGFTLLWFWANVDKMSFAVAPATIVGAIGGTATAWALQWATVHGMPAVAIAALVVLAFGLLMTILQRMSLLFNASYMLFVTVLCAPLLQKGEDFTQVTEAILLGAVWFGGLVWIVGKVFAGKAADGGEALDQAVAAE